MKQVNDVGVDVGSKELVCAMQCAWAARSNSDGVCQAPRRETEQFVRWATKGGRSARVCLEATGILQFAVCARVTRGEAGRAHGGQPAGDQRLCSRVHAAGQDRCAGCRGDAGLPATDALHTLAAPGARRFSSCRRSTAVSPAAPHANCTREKNRRHATDFAGASADAIAHDIEVNIRHLERRLERMHESGLKLVRGVPTLAAKLAHLVSAKGIGETSAMRLLAELLVLPR